METKFQTSFIPKKQAPSMGMAGNPVIRKPKSSIFMTLATLIFIASLVGAVGSYAWKYVLISSQETYKKDLAKRREQFDLNLIEDLKEINIKINMARQLMNNHIAVSQVFDTISRFTIQNVRFLSFELESGTGVGAGASQFKIDMKGLGSNFSTVAFQSDVLAKLEDYNLRKAVENPILADPIEDDRGVVSFNLTATIDPKNISYQKLITTSVTPPETSPAQ
jgi:hypothetical protein